jgi:hypothetical protein
MTTKILADELNLPITTGTATSFSAATVVRLVNTDTASHIITVVESQNGTGIGSITMPGGTVEQIVKTANHCVYADSNKVKGTKVGFTN